MNSTKSRVGTVSDTGPLEAQLLKSVNDLNKIDINASETDAAACFDARLLKRKVFLEEEKRQLRAKKEIESEILGSDAESEDDDAFEKEELDEKVWGGKMVVRKAKVIDEAVKDAYIEKIHKVKSVINVAVQLLSIWRSVLGRSGQHDTPVKSGHRSQQTDDVELAAQVLESSQDFSKGCASGENCEKECKVLRARLSKQKSNIKAAFEDDISETIECKAVQGTSSLDVIVNNMKEVYIPKERSLSLVPDAISKLHNLIAPVVAGTVAQLQLQLAKKTGENETLKEQCKETATTKAELETAQKEVTDLKFLRAKLEKKLKDQAPLVDIAIAIRPGVIEASKRIFLNNEMHIVRGNPQKAIVDLKNEAVHRGQYVVDAYLLSLGRITEEDFLHVYNFPPHDWVVTSVKAMELFNMRASMIFCYFETEYTHSQKIDVLFDSLYHECLRLFVQYNNDNTISPEVIARWDKCAIIETKLKKMRTLVANTVQKEKERSRS
ncbi:hypothetical protein EG329_011747 [Mollisiaceae sp. DMI_Dod_QoI]|nr:hypothetical protein EG329_011747 [Helotiales sp. DMI_Dod_QoI]